MLRILVGAGEFPEVLLTLSVDLLAQTDSLYKETLTYATQVFMIRLGPIVTGAVSY